MREKKLFSKVIMVLTLVVISVMAIPSRLAEAVGITLREVIEHVEVFKKDPAYVQGFIIDWYIRKDYHVDSKDYSAETFRPGDNVTYGELARWIYCRTNYPEKCPSQKKAIKWLKKAYNEVALAHPEYAEEISAAFSDGKQGKFNYKKSATWDWLRSTCYIVAWYNNDGAWVNGYDDFDFDIHRVDRFLATGGAERDNGDELKNYFISLYYPRKYANYGGDTIHPSRIAALDVLGELGLVVSSVYPPWNWKGR